MTKRLRCPRCGGTRAWIIRGETRRGTRGRYDGRPGLPLRLTRHQWGALLRWQLRGLSAAASARECGGERTRVVRALLYVRAAMLRAVPPVFHGTVEVDETYLGGRWRNWRRGRRVRGSRRGRGTSTTPVVGILCRDGQVWAHVVPDLTTQRLLALMRRQVQPGSVVCTDALRLYTGMAAKGDVHRLVHHDHGECRSRHGAHITGLDGCWGDLTRRLAAKGGIRRERLPLYLAEYVWRDNHRWLSLDQQVRLLMTVLQKKHVPPGG